MSLSRCFLAAFAVRLLAFAKGAPWQLQMTTSDRFSMPDKKIQDVSDGVRCRPSSPAFFLWQPCHNLWYWNSHHVLPSLYPKFGRLCQGPLEHFGNLQSWQHQDDSVRPAWSLAKLFKILTKAHLDRHNDALVQAHLTLAGHNCCNQLRRFHKHAVCQGHPQSLAPMPWTQTLRIIRCHHAKPSEPPTCKLQINRILNECSKFLVC